MMEIRAALIVGGIQRMQSGVRHRPSAVLRLRELAIRKQPFMCKVRLPKAALNRSCNAAQSAGGVFVAARTWVPFDATKIVFLP